MVATTSAPSPTQNLKEIEELTISIGIKGLNPTMLSAEYLSMSGIVPSDWELAKQPVLSPRGSQVNYKNGINIVAQPNVINFVEGIGTKQLNQLSFANLALQYIEKLANAEYEGLSINPKIIVPFQGDENTGKNFINQELLKPGNWSTFEGASPQSAINLFYQLTDYNLGININPARLQQPDNQVISAVLFAGSFTYNLTTLEGENRLNNLKEKINQWQDNLTTFRSLINEKFLKKAVSPQESLFDN